MPRPRRLVEGLEINLVTARILIKIETLRGAACYLTKWRKKNKNCVLIPVIFGARFAVFVLRELVLPGPCPATRNLSFWRFHRHRHPVVSTRCFTGLARVGVKIPQDGNRANRYEHVATVHEHVWRTVCSVCATGARVAHPVPCNS
jgi:hypothetical protein